MILWVATTLSFAVVSSAEAVTVVIGKEGSSPSITDNRIIRIDDLKVCLTGDLINCPNNDQVTEDTVVRFYNVIFREGSFSGSEFVADSTVFGDPNDPGFNASCLETTIQVGEEEGLCFWSNQDLGNDILDKTQNAINKAINDEVVNNSNITDHGQIAVLKVPPSPFGGFNPDLNHDLSNEYRIPTDFNGNITYVLSSNSSNNSIWDKVSSPAPLATDDVVTYALFQFLGEDTEFASETEPPKIPESSSAIAVILTGIFLVLTKGKKSE